MQKTNMKSPAPTRNRRNETTKLTYKALCKLAPNATRSDPAVEGKGYQLRYRCKANPSGKTYVSAQFRYKFNGKWTSIELDRLPTTHELSPSVLSVVKQGGKVIHKEVQDHFVLEPFREKARGYARKLLAGLDPKGEKGVEGFTLRQAMARHAQRMRNKSKAESSIAEYEWALNYSFKDWLDVPLVKLTRDMAAARHEAIGKERGHAPANKAMRYFRAVWNTAMKADATLPVAPTIAVEFFKQQPRNAAIPLAKLPAWFKEVDALTNDVLRDLLLFTVLTGLRKATVCAINCEHIDTGTRTLFIPKPKGGEDRAFTIPLSDAAMAIVKRRLAATNGGWLFPSQTSKGGHIVDPRTDDVCVPFTPHGLRHTYISAAAQAKVSPYHTKLLVNHKLPSNDVTAGYIQTDDVDALRPSQQAITDYFKQHGLTLALPARDESREVSGKVLPIRRAPARRPRMA
jgi:integrase